MVGLERSSPEQVRIFWKKSVAQAAPTHVMSVFLFPRTLCIDLERMMNEFWWGREMKEGGIC